MMGQTAVVTGGAGFIGSQLVSSLLQDGWQVRVIDDFNDYYDPSIKHQNIEPFLEHPNFRCKEGDVRDATAVGSVVDADVDVVFHLAARAGVRPSIEQPGLYYDVNVMGTSTLLQAVQESQIPKFIFASSSSVYGNNKKVPFSESDPVEAPISPYAATKRAGELMCHAHHHLHQTKIACLRFFTVYGPGQRPEMAIHRFVRKIESGEPIPVFGDGSTARDYTFVDDIIDGIKRAVNAAEHYHLWNLGGSRVVTLNALIQTIEHALQKKAVIQRLPMQPGDVDRTMADTSLIERELQWQPKTSLAEGIDAFVRWYRGEA